MTPHRIPERRGWQSRSLESLNRDRPVKPGWPVIDVHAHVFCPAAEMLAQKNPAYAQAAQAQRALLGEASMAYNASMFEQLSPRLTESQARIRDMDAMGVDMQVLSPSPTQFHYWADRSAAQMIVRLQNEQIAALCRLHPRRFAGLGTAALQHPDLAIDQLRDAVRQLDLRGVQISTRIGERELSDPALENFWAEAQRLGAVIFVHPYGCSLGDRIVPWYLSNIIGQPLETTIALSHLIFSGVLERHGGLKVCAAHGGGYLPCCIGRSDHGWHVRPEARTAGTAPSAQLRRIFFDTLTHSPSALTALARQVGSSQIMLGTDYPFDMGAYDGIELLQAADLNDEERQSIAGLNAVRLFGLSLSPGG